MDSTQLAVNTYEKIADIYTDTYFNDLSDTPHIATFLKMLPPEGLILDIGSGPGQFASYMKDKGFQVTGIDLSERMIAIAQKKVPGVTFQKMDMRHLDFPDNTFDGILSAYSLIHICYGEVHETLHEFERVLKPKGKMLLIVQKGEPDKIVNEPLMYGESMFFNFFTKDSVRQHLQNANFIIISQTEERHEDSNALSDTLIYTIAEKVE